MIARPEIGTVAWFKERKRSLLADIRALEDFSTAYALVSRLVEHAEIDDNDEVTEQQRGALYMSAVVTYARQFLLSSTKHSERRVYPTRHLKSDAPRETVKPASAPVRLASYHYAKLKSCGRHPN
jgi:hypothetical protein